MIRWVKCHQSLAFTGNGKILKADDFLGPVIRKKFTQKTWEPLLRYVEGT